MMRDILWATMPGEFRFESKVNLESKYLNFLSHIPGINNVTAYALKKSGKVFLRVLKVDKNLPDDYYVSGWKIRNKSERGDGVYFSRSGYVSLGNQGGGEDLPRKG